MAEPVVQAKGRVAGRRCSRCGGDVAFRPGKDALGCKYCDHLEPIVIDARLRVMELDYDTALTTAPTGPAAELSAGGREIECKNCGARTLVTGQATRCPFCDNAIVVEIPDDRPQILPQSVLAFGIDRKVADGHFAEWLASRWFAPSDLIKRAKKDGMDGVYLPYWIYASDTTTHYTGQRGEHYWENEEYTDSQGKRQTRRVQRTRWYPASGTVQVPFDDVLVCASRSLPEPLVDALEPWDLTALWPFDDRFLAGFLAERYAIDLQQGFSRAVEKMAPTIRSAIEHDIGGDEQQIQSMDVHHENKRFKHALLPLWISAFRYHDKVFRVTVNARTGEVSGERPWSWIKIALFVLLCVAVVSALAWLLLRPRG